MDADAAARGAESSQHRTVYEALGGCGCFTKACVLGEQRRDDDDAADDAFSLGKLLGRRGE